MKDERYRIKSGQLYDLWSNVNVMVWGCMTKGGVGSLTFIDGISDEAMYLKILKKHLKENKL